MDKICQVPACGPTSRLRKGLCNKHYKRSINGRPLDVDVRHSKGTPIAERYWSFVDKSAGGESCWPWTGATRLSNTTDYGRIRYQNKTYGAHRIGYEIANGMEPTSLSPTVPVHHTCGNSLCQQPKHLQATTKAENTAEMLERHAYIKRIKYLESLLDINGIPY